MSVEVKEIKQKWYELRKFIHFGIDLYKGNPYFVPPLVLDELNTLRPCKNPAFEFCESIYYMAYRDGVPVGRIAGIINKQVNDRTGGKMVRFGLVDFIDNVEVVDALFDAVKKWGKSKGMNELVGPLGFSDMDPEGMLIEGFDQVATMATIYNYPYYPKHMERMGMEKDADWLEYRIKIPNTVPEKHQRISDIIARKYEVRTIKFTKSKDIVSRYGQDIFKLINEAYDKLYGYSPLSPRQINHYINMYLPVLRLENVALIVDKEDKLIGVGIAMPSMSKALQKGRGRLLPTGWFHLLRALKGKNNLADLLLVAVKPEYQSKGVNALLFSDLIPVFVKNGYKCAESNPELELNQKVQSQWQYFDTEQHKRRRSYKIKI